MRVLILLLLLLSGCATGIKKNNPIDTDASLKEIPKNACDYDRTQPIKVAIIDTGLDLSDPRFKDHICPTGHKDLTGSGLEDLDDHGTHVAGLIQKYAGEGNYCFLIYKFYSEEALNYINTNREVEAFNAANQNMANVINLSGGGDSSSLEEYISVKKNKLAIIVAATGNEGKNIDAPGDEYYPAAYKLDNIVAVGSVDKNGKLSKFSNRSKKMVVEVGQDVYSTFPKGEFGYMSGTSMATAVRTGKIVHYMLNNCNQEKK